MSNPFREAVHRDDGTQLAEFGLWHGRAVVKMYAPDGIDHRRATWSLTAGELQRLADAADKAAIEMACQHKLSDPDK